MDDEQIIARHERNGIELVLRHGAEYDDAFDITVRDTETRKAVALHDWAPTASELAWVMFSPCFAFAMVERELATWSAPPKTIREVIQMCHN